MSEKHSGHTANPRLRAFIEERQAAGITEPLEIPDDILEAFNRRVAAIEHDPCHRGRVLLITFTDAEADEIIKRNTH